MDVKKDTVFFDADSSFATEQLEQSATLVNSPSTVDEQLMEVRCEFREKSAILRDGRLRGPFDWQQLDISSFFSEVFMRHGMDVPFEEVQSPEFLLWRAQKEEQKMAEALGNPIKEIDYSKCTVREYNPIVVLPTGRIRKIKLKSGMKVDKQEMTHRIILRNDEKVLKKDIIGSKDCMASPCTFVGRTNSTANARYCYAIAVDLDDVGPDELLGLFDNCFDKNVEFNGKTCHIPAIVPAPNILTNSGHGLHVYYLIDREINITAAPVRKLLQRIKDNLTALLYQENTSRLLQDKSENRRKPKGQSILQPFRLPDTLTKFGDKITSWQNLDAPMYYSIAELNKFLPKDSKLTKAELESIYRYNYKSQMTLDEARRKYQEWYQARIVEGRWMTRKWHVNRAVYNWWLDKIRNKTEDVVGHRFWCVMCLFIYAIKCDVSKEEAMEDALNLVPLLDSYIDTRPTRKKRNDRNNFTASDVLAASNAYEESYAKFPISKIDSLTGIRIEKSIRKGRKRKDHVKLMNFVRDTFSYPEGDWREGNGRKPEYAAVREWRKNHPGCSNKSQCARDTGLHRNTVTKWWNGEAAVVQPKKIEDQPEEEKYVFLTRLFAPGSDYHVEGYTHEETVEIVISEKWKELGWDLVWS